MAKKIKFEINLTDKWFYTFLGLVALIIGGLVVYANNPAVMGHTLAEIQMPACNNDQYLGRFSNDWACRALPTASTTVSGIVQLSNSRTSTLTTRAATANAVKLTNDNADSRVLKSGDTMSGNLAMGNNKVTGLATPTHNNDAANKKYVDDAVAASSGSGGCFTLVRTRSEAADSPATTNCPADLYRSCPSGYSSIDNFCDCHIGGIACWEWTVDPGLCSRWAYRHIKRCTRVCCKT